MNAINRWGIQNIWRGFFSLAVLQGIFANWVFLESRREGGRIQGISLEASLILALGISVLLFCLWQLINSFLSPLQVEIRAKRWINWISHSNRSGYTIFLLTFLLILCSYSLTLAPEIKEPFSRAILVNLSPFLAWFCGLIVLVLLLLSYRDHLTPSKNPYPNKLILWLMMGYVIIVFMGWNWLVSSIYPIVSERVGWNSLGVPLLEYQTLLAWGAGYLVLFLLFKLNKGNFNTSRINKQRFLIADLAIGFLLWVSAVAIWQSQPILANWFVSAKIAPNYEHYPYSDARAYDENAQSALIGNGFLHYNNIEIRRPLHAAYLTILHLIAGQEYERVIFLQILVLALLPVGLYAVTMSLHNRASGVMAAILIIFRESNSIAITSNITSSHAKLFMVDLLTALVVVFFVYWAIRWLKQIEDGQSNTALVCGGALGLAILIRSETIFLSLAPMILTASALLPQRMLKRWLLQMGMFFVGMMLVITPWMVRNWQRTGRFTLDSAVFRQLIIIQRFKPLGEAEPFQPAAETSTTAQTDVSSTPSASIEPQPVAGVTQTTPNPTNETETPPASQASSLLETAFKNPAELMQVFAAHYLNNQIQMLLIHPAAFRSIDSGINLIGHKKIDRYLDECCSLTGYTRRLPFWKKWDGHLPRQTAIPLLFTTVFLAVGIAKSQRRHSRAGLIPITAAFVYILFYSALRNSGGRYLLAVDWTSITYYSIGSVQITMLALDLIKPKFLLNEFDKKPITHIGPSSNGRAPLSPILFAAVMVLLIVGISIPMIEWIIPGRYTIERHNQMLDAVLSPNPSIPEAVRLQMQDFLTNGGKAISGRGMYPQFFPTNYGTHESDAGSRSPQPYPRLVFDHISNLTLDITLPIIDETVHFPNGSDTLVLLCLDETRALAEPLAAAVFNRDGQLQRLYLRFPFPESPACPLTNNP